MKETYNSSIERVILPICPEMSCRSTFYDQTWVSCIREKCGKWNIKDEQCGILTIK